MCVYVYVYVCMCAVMCWSALNESVERDDGG